MRSTAFWWVLTGCMLLLDIYFFQALKVVAGPASPRARLTIYIVYWVLCIAAILVLLILPYIHFEKQARFARTTIFSMIAGFFFAKLIASLFFFIDDIRRGVEWLLIRFSAKTADMAVAGPREGITRSAFLSWAGMIAGGGLFGTLVYGFGNKYRYQVKRTKLNYANLPASFRGLKIVQLSDIHSGSFNDKKAVLRGIQKVMKEKPDLILFTGDLVNNVADEMDDYADIFSQLKAPMGVYSILGNHDYGDYVSWENTADKAANLEKLKRTHASMGWRLLMNESVILEKGGEHIALLGIENWSAKARFPKHGDLKKAHAGTEAYPFKILMSHDPSHWKAQVLEHFKDIDLMLSGHTHGMQFGVELPGLKWSPVQYMYHEWAGLYEQNGQKLYVNRGFGFLGYPGRVGILPEITVLELS